MKKLNYLCLVMLFVPLLYGCGDAGVQVKVGSNYETDFTFSVSPEPPIPNPALDFSQSERTSLNSEIRDYGSFIESLEVKSLTVQFDNFRENSSSPLNGEISVDINGIVFSSGNTTFINSQVIELAPDQANGFTNLASILRSSDVTVDLSAVTDAPLEDWNYDVIIGITAFATVQAD